MDLRTVYASDVLSRAFDVEEEEEIFNECEIEICNYMFEWEPNYVKKSCSRLFVLTGPAISGLVKANILKESDIVGTIKCETKPEVKSHVFAREVEGQLVYFVFVEKVLPENVFSWTEAVLKNLCDKSSEVNVLVVENIVNYRGPCKESSETFVKMLGSKNSLKRPNFERLDQPCLVEGLPAHFLTRAEIEGTQCLLYVVYSRDPHPYLFILEILKKLNLQSIVQGSKEKITRIICDYEPSSYLYM